MGLINKLVKNKSKEQLSVSNLLVRQRTNVEEPLSLNIHPDIINYVWFGDGKMKNYHSEHRNTHGVTISGISFYFTFDATD